MPEYLVRFLSIYQFKADYQAIDRLTGKAYRIRIDEPEGEIVGSYPKAPPEVLAAVQEFRNAHNLAF